MADEMDDYLEQARRAERYEGLVQEAIALLTEGDGAGFRALLSQNMVDSAGPDAIDAVIAREYLPFFQGAVNLGAETTISNTTDAWGNEGLTFYKSALFEDGAERPFVINIVAEQGRPVVANLLPGKTFEDMH